MKTNNEMDNQLIQWSICKMDELQSLLVNLEEKYFKQEVNVLFGGTIGQHMRHVLEFYECLLDGIDGSRVNYDERKRDLNLEANSKNAWYALRQIKLELKEIINNKMITLVTNVTSAEEKEELIVSSLYRELVYCLEHCTHHQALIKVGLYELGLLHLVDRDFGVAPSTVLHRDRSRVSSK